MKAEQLRFLAAQLQNRLPVIGVLVQRKAAFYLASEGSPDALQALTTATSPGLIHLLDNALSPLLLNQLSAQGLGIPWYGFARIGPHLADPDFCRALKRSGCVFSSVAGL